MWRKGYCRLVMYTPPTVSKRKVVVGEVKRVLGLCADGKGRNLGREQAQVRVRVSTQDS